MKYQVIYCTKADNNRIAIAETIEEAMTVVENTVSGCEKVVDADFDTDLADIFFVEVRLYDEAAEMKLAEAKDIEAENEILDWYAAPSYTSDYYFV